MANLWSAFDSFTGRNLISRLGSIRYGILAL